MRKTSHKSKHDKALENQENKAQERCSLVQEIPCLNNGSFRKETSGKQKRKLSKEQFKKISWNDRT